MKIGSAVFVGDRVVVVDKPCGITSEELATSWQHKLVHRIDKGTSGLVILAHDARTVQRLHKQMQAGGIQRSYLALVHGTLVAQTITSRLGRDRGDGLRGTVGDHQPGQRATTVLTPLRTTTIDDVEATVLTAVLVTGRTHQIRIHCAEAGHLIVGETVYRRDHVARGDRELTSSRLLLHSWRLRFAHPNTHESLELEAAPPQQLS